MKPIFLIGFMGSGKSTLGRAVSRATGLQLIDLDHYIEARFRRTIPEIFATEGEVRFRDLERRMLAEVGEFEDVIVACGGGTPCQPGNIDYMNNAGTTIRLRASEERLHDRLKKGRRKRPAIASLSDNEILETIRRMTVEREPFYSRAQHTFPSDLLENSEEIAASTERFIEMFNLPRKTEQ
ncbi:MAG: shikimate kinase [Clostridium sp.]|nr:shikimate kinase [Clostridium sp.]